MGQVRIKDPLIRQQAEAIETNRLSIEDKLRLAIDTNKAYLALTAPTASQRNDQVALMARQLNRLIRLQLRQLNEAE